MHNRIFIEEDKEFTLGEFAFVIKNAIHFITDADIDKNQAIYSGNDVYQAIHSLLDYINEHAPGRFKIAHTSMSISPQQTYDTVIVAEVETLTEHISNHRHLSDAGN